MTPQQEAHRLIDSVPQDKIDYVIALIRPYATADSNANNTTPETPKMKAFRKMQLKRKTSSSFDITIEQRDASVEEKYGSIT